MTKENKSPVGSSIAKKAEIQLGDENYTVEKLKAGKFYEAQKLFVDIIRAATQTRGDSDQVDMSNVVGIMFSDWPKKVVKFVCFCINKDDVTEDLILETAYPDQINEAFKTCLELNNVFENIKKSAAPIGQLGGQVPSK